MLSLLQNQNELIMLINRKLLPMALNCWPRWRPGNVLQVTQDRLRPNNLPQSDQQRCEVNQGYSGMRQQSQLIMP